MQEQRLNGSSSHSRPKSLGSASSRSSQPLPPRVDPNSQYWLSDAPEAQREVATQVKNSLDKIIVQLEKQANAEARAAMMEKRRIEREHERRELQKQRELARREREIEVQCEGCIERIIKRIERDDASVVTEDGRPYAEPMKKGKGTVYKVRGTTCKDWFRGEVRANCCTLCSIHKATA